ncbi:GNAT family N-acetyltransferase [Campylobacter canadensis]|uniref:GNAT family N-acetyltransferase n=1 Tax=Campylobacter canadensis TaxID=449520 RepID=A0ABS7WQ52_9BACT|nr:GNAT family N-acetyltransferase [Campylobacter canadensis]MBZ7986895.1 GNAT family N-acetyltransferase [Campylobacter canadensis]MBZ7994217.1 GNAT family N-acetyltransferase [Campylobacter canadensis]MBZ7995791.1 GNAT family N-acetyltransferase [Campylobacter canadensis]MBZ7997932.1 GNAT family N-acetyltransferase [Campylobacter canadensis]MBZ7999549.1 GNAT family N-acetyltransferase [Campylobacter canadensis]
MIFKINLNDNKQKLLLIDFIKANSLEFSDEIDLAFVVFYKDKIIACICKFKLMIKYVIIDKEHQKENIFSLLLNTMITYAKEQNINTLRLCTCKHNAIKFQNFSFRLLCTSKELCLLEYGYSLFDEFINNIRAKLDTNKSYTSIVMNANPFTLGHKYLIDCALKHNENLILFIVSEDKSFFTFKERFMIVKENLKKYKNILIFPSGDYIISNATFSTYFLKQDINLAKSYLDAKIFSSLIAPCLNIKSRFVGSEPNCKVTNAYNMALKECFKEDNLDLFELSRISINNKIISASLIRKYIAENNFNEIKKYLSDTSLKLIKKCKNF